MEPNGRNQWQGEQNESSFEEANGEAGTYGHVIELLMWLAFLVVGLAWAVSLSV